MGYAGLENWVDSDMAADLVGNIVDKVCKELSKELKEKGNEYNTGGPENVAMFVEAFIKPNVEEWAMACSNKLYVILDNALQAMEKLVERTKKKGDWDTESNRLSHLRSYQRMVKNLKYVLNRLSAG